jgi:hypothetical protein
MTSLKRDINHKIMQDGYDVYCIVTVKDVIEAVSRLKPGKYDGCMSLSSDHVRHACDEWYILSHTCFYVVNCTDCSRQYHGQFIYKYYTTYPQRQELKLFRFH